MNDFTGTYENSMVRARDTIEGKVILYMTCQELIRENNGKYLLAVSLLPMFSCTNEELELYKNKDK